MENRLPSPDEIPEEKNSIVKDPIVDRKKKLALKAIQLFTEYSVKREGGKIEFIIDIFNAQEQKYLKNLFMESGWDAKFSRRMCVGSKGNAWFDTIITIKPISKKTNKIKKEKNMGKIITENEEPTINPEHFEDIPETEITEINKEQYEDYDMTAAKINEIKNEITPPSTPDIIPDPPSMFAKFLIQYRVNSRIQISDLARRINVTDEIYKSFESDSNSLPDANTIRAIVAVLRLSPNQELALMQLAGYNDED